jgi:hypothetical protein
MKKLSSEIDKKFWTTKFKEKIDGYSTVKLMSSNAKKVRDGCSLRWNYFIEVGGKEKKRSTLTPCVGGGGTMAARHTWWRVLSSFKEC